MSNSKEMVQHPDHYNKGKFEVIDVIYDWGLNFSLGSAVKYVARAGHKFNDIEDLEKAAEYIMFEIANRKGMTIDEYKASKMGGKNENS